MHVIGVAKICGKHKKETGNENEPKQKQEVYPKLFYKRLRGGHRQGEKWNIQAVAKHTMKQNHR